MDSEDDDGPEPEGLKSMPPRKDRKQARDDKAEMPLHPIKFEVLPPSSVWCTGDSKKNRYLSIEERFFLTTGNLTDIHHFRICRFRNVCYKPDNQKWFIFQTNRTIQHNVPVHRYADQLLELTTMDGHPKYYWNFDEASPFDEQFKNVEIRYETAPHFIFSRVSPDNIFHTFHDDIIGLYFMLKEYMGEGVFGNEFSFMSPYRFLFFDDHGVAKNDHLFQTLAGDRALRYKSYLHYDSHITCFQEAVFGNSKVN